MLTGMAGHVVLIGGPAGAGKTTSAEAWASSQEEPTAHLNLDMVRRFLCSGLQHPHVTGWSEETARQYAVARKVTVAAARVYVANDINCVIDDGMFPERVLARYELWASMLSGVRHHLVILLPDLAACLERNAQRTGLKRLDEDLVRRFHAASTKWVGTGVPVIDTTKMTVRDTVDAITRVLEEAAGAPAGGR